MGLTSTTALSKSGPGSNRGRDTPHSPDFQKWSLAI